MCGSHLTELRNKKKKHWDSWDLTQTDIDAISSSEDSNSDHGSPSSTSSTDSNTTSNLPEQREIFYNAVHWGDMQRVTMLWNGCKSDSQRQGLLVYRSPSARKDYAFNTCKVLPTPLAWACWQGHNRIVEFLLLNGAPVHGHDDKGEHSPLFLAVMNNKFEIVKMLANYRCHLDEVDSESGQSAFQVAAKGLSVDIVEHFVTCGLDPPDSEKDKYHHLVQKAIERGRYNLKVRAEARKWLELSTTLPDVLIQITCTYIF